MDSPKKCVSVGQGLVVSSKKDTTGSGERTHTHTPLESNICMCVHASVCKKAPTD